MGLRLLAVAPTVASIIVVALTVVLLVAGTNPSSANDNYWLALNASNIGANIVEVKAVDNPDSSLGALTGAIPGLDGVLNNITNGIGKGVGDVQGEVVGKIVKSLGFKDFYFMYASKMCEGIKEGANGYRVGDCYPYTATAQGLANVTGSIPNTFKAGNMQVSVPLLSSLGGMTKSLSGVITGASGANLAFLIISCTAAGLTAIGSALAFLRKESGVLATANLAFSSVAANVLLIQATVITAIVYGVQGALGTIANGFSLYIKPGGTFVALIWVSAVFALMANSFWTIVWWVEFRRSAFSRRSRTSSQIGNYWGTLGELAKDFKLNGHFRAPEEHENLALKTVMV